VILPQLRMPHPYAQGESAAAVDPVPAEQSVFGGIRKSASSDLGGVNTTWEPIIGFSASAMQDNPGVTLDLAAGTIAISETGNYQITVNCEVSYTVDKEVTRRMLMRLFNVTDNAAVPNADLSIGIGAWSDFASSSYTVLAYISAGLVGKALRMEISASAGDTFAAVQVLSALFAAVKMPLGAGPQGLQGNPGEPGGAYVSAWWQYQNQTAAPPATGSLRMNSTSHAVNDVKTLWVHHEDAEGLVWTLNNIQIGDKVLVRNKQGERFDLSITAVNDTIPGSTGYSTIVGTVTLSQGTVTSGSQVQISVVR
jgi:hypothetical protein